MNRSMRESGIELLKILAIFIIVLAHMAQCLSKSESYNFYINLNQASMEPMFLILNFIRPLGALGNDIFFICSSWFLCDKNFIKKRKIVYMETDVLIVSISALAIFLFFGKYHISNTDIMDSIFPTLTNSYWYITCYMIILFVAPWMNLILHNMSQRTLLITSLLLGMVYFFAQTFADFLGIDLFFSNRLIEFAALYIIVAYVKTYRMDFVDSKKANIISLLVGIVGWISFVVCANFLGERISLLSSFQIWDKNHNIFLVIIAVSLFCLFKKIKFKSAIVNYISGLSLPVYLLHSNVLVINYLLPDCWSWIFSLYGHSYDILSSIVLAIVFFTISAIWGGCTKNVFSHQHINWSADFLSI